MKIPFDRRGFTLIELLVTVIIIGVLAAIGVPQYLQTVENGKADDAVATLNMIGTTNKMFALDHTTGGVSIYATGQFGAAPNPAGACGAGTCCAAGACTTVANTPACELVWCNYLADQNWLPATSAGGAKPYNYFACDPGSVTGGCPAVGLVSYAYRNAGTDGPAGNGWNYTLSSAGVIVGGGTNVPAASY